MSTQPYRDFAWTSEYRGKQTANGRDVGTGPARRTRAAASRSAARGPSSRCRRSWVRRRTVVPSEAISLDNNFQLGPTNCEPESVEWRERCATMSQTTKPPRFLWIRSPCSSLGMLMQANAEMQKEYCNKYFVKVSSPKSSQKRVKNTAERDQKPKTLVKYWSRSVKNCSSECKYKWRAHQC